MKAKQQSISARTLNGNNLDQKSNQTLLFATISIHHLLLPRNHLNQTFKLGSNFTPVTPPANSSRFHSIPSLYTSHIHFIHPLISLHIIQERRYLLKEFPQLLSSPPNSNPKLLEVGCGNGSTVLPILRYFVFFSQPLFILPHAIDFFSL